MSVGYLIEAWVYCDVCGDPLRTLDYTLEIHERSKKPSQVMRREAKRNGWLYKKRDGVMHDVCPQCAVDLEL